MKSKLITLLFFFATSSFAAEKVLECNLSDGDTQGFTIYANGSSFIMKELDTSGSEKTRVLSNTEWNSGKIRIYTRDPSQAKAFVKREADGSWFFSYKTLGYAASGYADCF